MQGRRLLGTGRVMVTDQTGTCRGGAGQSIRSSEKNIGNARDACCEMRSVGILQVREYKKRDYVRATE